MSHLLHEHERGGREPDPGLIGEEPAATGASEAETVVGFLDPVLDVCNIIWGLNRHREDGNEES